MRLDFLGTGAGSFRGSGRQPCGALLDTLLLDCGAGVTGRLFDLDRFDQVDAVLISHLHTDHFAGLFDFLLHTVISRRTKPLTVLSPPGLGAILDAVYSVGGTVRRPELAYPFRLLEGRAVRATIGRWSVRSVAMDHTVLDLGYLVADEHLSAFYSGDTREPSAALEENADYLIHEATFPDRQAVRARDYGHSTASDAARAARAMGARKLWLTHVAGERSGDEAEVARDARREFPDSTLAEDRSSFTL